MCGRLSQRRSGLEDAMSRLLGEIHVLDAIVAQPIPHRAEARTRGSSQLRGFGLVSVRLLLCRFLRRMWFRCSQGHPFVDAGYGAAFNKDLVAVCVFAKDGALPLCVVACLAVLLFEG